MGSSNGRCGCLTAPGQVLRQRFVRIGAPGCAAAVSACVLAAHIVPAVCGCNPILRATLPLIPPAATAGAEAAGPRLSGARGASCRGGAAVSATGSVLQGPNGQRSRIAGSHSSIGCHHETVSLRRWRWRSNQTRPVRSFLKLWPVCSKAGRSQDGWRPSGCTRPGMYRARTLVPLLSVKLLHVTAMMRRAAVCQQSGTGQHDTWARTDLLTCLDSTAAARARDSYSSTRSDDPD